MECKVQTLKQLISSVINKAIGPIFSGKWREREARLERYGIPFKMLTRVRFSY